jgi:chromate transporter
MQILAESGRHIPAQYFKKHGKRPGIVVFVDRVTAAAMGAIA